MTTESRPAADRVRASHRPPSLVHVEDLRVVRGSRTVLSIDSLDLEERETLAIVGPNGAGKSTLLLAIAGLVDGRHGTIEFRGSRVEPRGSLGYRRHLGLVLPDPLLLDTSVFANVAAGLRFRGAGRTEIERRVMEWLGRLGVGHLADRPARQISSGEAQRVSLARALVLEPDLLLLDEPFASVDAATRARLIDDFEKLLQETQVACAFVTHDLDEAVRLGDRMAVIVRGTLRQVDVPRRVLETPADEDVAAFVGVETRVEGRLIANVDGETTVDAAGIRIEAVSDLAPGRFVLCCLRPEDVTLWRPGRGRALPETDSLRSAGHVPATPMPFISSARNQLSGPIRRMVPTGALMRVSIDCGFPLVASITRVSAEEMGLVEGEEVHAAFKASAVHLIPMPDPATAAEEER